MSKDTWYVTHRMLEDFLVPYYRDTGNRIRLQDALLKMKEQGLLSAAPLPRPVLSWSQTPEEFEKAFVELPLNASLVMDNAELPYTDLFREEQATFPQGQDVFCHKMLPCLTAEPRALSYFEIFYVVRGMCEMSFGGESIRLRAGDVCIMPPDARHAIPLEPDCQVVDIVVRASTFDAQFGDLLTKSGVLASFFRESLFGKSAPNFLVIHTPSEDPQVCAHLRGLIIECYSADSHTNSCVISWLKLFLSQTLRACRDEVEIYRALSGGNPRADCGEILQYIQQNYRTVRLSSLAKQFHYNETYLSRMLQTYARKSFTEIVRDIRMKRAEEYLNNSGLRIHEIASLVGYSSVDHFSRAFKATHGMSPQAYRRRGPARQAEE